MPAIQPAHASVDDHLPQRIADLYNRVTSTTDHSWLDQEREDVLTVMSALDAGTLRAAQPSDHGWQVNAWVKQAILLFFRMQPTEAIPTPLQHYADKVPLKYADHAPTDHRMVPMATVRRGAFVGPRCVLMPCFINTGAYVGAGTMVDTWATIGSCAQIGEGVHVSGGAGIGGVLEPLQAQPTIIEDHAFIGARCEVAEGVRVGHHAVLAMGVFLGQSTKLYHRATGKVTQGEVPPGAVVVPGSLPGRDGAHSVSCAIVVKQVDEQTRRKTSINALLRDL